MRGEAVEQSTDGMCDGVDGSGPCLAQEVLKLGEDLLDGVEVGGVFREEQEPCAGRPDGLAHGLALVAAEVVQNDDITGPQGGDEHLLHIEAEALAIDRPVYQPGGVDTVMAQGREEGRRAPLAVGRGSDQALPARRPTPQRGHVGLGPGLIDEDQALGRDLILMRLPLAPPAGDVRASTLAGHRRFF